MIFLQFDENGNELYRHYKPELLTKEQLSKGLLVQSVPEPLPGQSGTLKYNGKTLYYADKTMIELQDENVLLKAQIHANSERADFQEELIVEMAMDIYQ